MKATEVMIGDWIWDIEDKKPYQMTYLMICGLAEYKENEERCQPIPLTPEILEKNGSYKDLDDYNGYIVGNNIGFWIVEDGFEFGHITVRYVHELQHALRLCGLNSLADNLKI